MIEKKSSVLKEVAIASTGEIIGGIVAALVVLVLFTKSQPAPIEDPIKRINMV